MFSKRGNNMFIYEEKKVSSQEVYKGKIIKVRVDDVLLPNGHQSTREVVEPVSYTHLVFVGSGIFKSGNPEKFASAIVQAVTYPKDKILFAQIHPHPNVALQGSIPGPNKYKVSHC